ncbi:MAG: hypothetical protein PHU85_19175, partial [Phycisphaerae bacterium]|nr:hypothetical protein [Phycisphaerae bacterium]
MTFPAEVCFNNAGPGELSVIFREVMMKSTGTLSRVIALSIAGAMLFGAASCSKKEKESKPAAPGESPRAERPDSRLPAPTPTPAATSSATGPREQPIVGARARASSA